MAQPTVATLEQRSLAMKAETTYGTDVFAGTVVAGDVQEVYNVQVEPTIAMTDMPSIGGKLGGLGVVPGAKAAMVTFDQMLRGAGAAYSASVKPNFDLPLRGCGFAATGTFGVGTENWSYQPRSDLFESMTIYVMQKNGETSKLAGAFGDVQLIFAIGRPVVARYRFMGIYVQPADTPTIVAKQFTPTPQWPVCLSAAFQIGTENYGPDFATVQVNSGNVIEPIEGMNAASGLAGVIIAARRMSMTIDPGVVARATFDWLAKWEGGTLVDASLQTNGAQYIRVKASAPTAQLRSRQWSTRGQKAIFSAALDLVTTAAADNEFVLLAD